MRTRVVQSISDIAAADWNSLLRCGNPFLNHAFLLALEESGAACAETGWYPCHVVCEGEDGSPARRPAAVSEDQPLRRIRF